MTIDNESQLFEEMMSVSQLKNTPAYALLLKVIDEQAERLQGEIYAASTDEAEKRAVAHWRMLLLLREQFEQTVLAAGDEVATTMKHLPPETQEAWSDNVNWGSAVSPQMDEIFKDTIIPNIPLPPNMG